MKVFIIVLFSFLLNSFSYATRLHIYDEEDISVVANNVADFWVSHKEIVPILVKGDLKSEEWGESFKNLSQSSTSLFKEFKKDKVRFKLDLTQTIEYVVENKIRIEELLGQNETKNFKNGLLLLKRVIDYSYPSLQNKVSSKEIVVQSIGSESQK